MVKHYLRKRLYCQKNTLMNRKFKQWLSTIPPVSTKQTIASRPNTLKTHNNTTKTYDVENTGPGCRSKDLCFN